MNKLILLLGLALAPTVHAQKRLYTVYTDSALWVNDADAFIRTFVRDVQQIKPGLVLDARAVLNTQPALIFYNNQDHTVNLPLWRQVIEPQKQFFYKLAGSEAEGKKVFGHLFNGFYLPHELGHALQHAAGKEPDNGYDKEYFANTIAVLYWRKLGKQKELDASYRYARKYLRQLTNPVPAGMDEKVYLTTHYAELTLDPYQYGYFEFSQLIRIYEDKTLPDFDTYVKRFLE